MGSVGSIPASGVEGHGFEPYVRLWAHNQCWHCNVLLLHC